MKTKKKAIRRVSPFTALDSGHSFAGGKGMDPCCVEVAVEKRIPHGPSIDMANPSINKKPCYSHPVVARPPNDKLQIPLSNGDASSTSPIPVYQFIGKRTEPVPENCISQYQPCETPTDFIRNQQCASGANANNCEYHSASADLPGSSATYEKGMRHVFF